MLKFLTASLLFLAFAFYEASGGDDFVSSAEAVAPRIVADAGAAEGAPLLLPQAGSISETPVIDARFPVTVAAYDRDTFEARTGLFAARALESQLTEVRSLAGELRTVTGEAVNMRSGPGTAHGVVATWPRGTQAMLLGTEGSWGRVQVEGTEGWIYTGLLQG